MSSQNIKMSRPIQFNTNSNQTGRVMRRKGQNKDDYTDNGSSSRIWSSSPPSRMEKMQELSPKNYTVSKDITWKVANGLMAVLFFIAAVLQVNDPDSAIWIMMYLIPGLICCAIIIFPDIQEFWLFRSSILFQIAVSLAALVYTIYLGSNEIVKHKTNILETEEGREAGGLAITVAWLLIALKIDSKSIQTMSPSSWLKVILVAVLPLALTGVWMFTVDTGLSPEHCKSILKKISQRN